MTTGCAEEPTCSVDGVIAGDVTGEFAWAGVGHDECELLGDRVDFREGDDHLYFEPGVGSNFAWKVGVYDDISVGFSTINNSWSASGCGVAIDTFSREDWTKFDYMLVTGRIQCPPLDDVDSTIELQDVRFTAYLVEAW